ncbi:MAG: methionine--tRNA ligase [Bacteroidetes bacterium]|nr:methionine--tRNA ligase [Bacteroidota bacterium]
MPAKRTLVTAALPYANGPLHVGHLAGAYVPADMYVRYMRLRYGKDSVLFICGSDEHGVPITISAEKEGVTPKDIVDRYHTLNKSTFERLGISFDYYGRTSSEVHRAMSQDFFRTLNSSGNLSEKEEPQLYDEQAKMFLPDRYVEGTCPVCSNPEARGDQCDRCGTYLNQTELINPRSKITGNKPVVRPTKHWYFRLSKFQKSLEEWVETKAGSWREMVVQQTRSWLKSGLQDRPITRDLDWGVPVPAEGADGKVLYVWFDAPIGYISATKELLPDSWQNWWREDENLNWVAFLGKDNIVFHTIMFPAMLEAYNAANTGLRYTLPTNVPANEFMNLEGRKLSKSKGWTIEPHEILSRYDADLIRYAIACNLPESKDSDFSWKDFQAHVNNELADILGNFANRVLTFVKNNFDAKVPDAEPDASFLDEYTTLADTIAGHYERFEFREVTTLSMDFARRANKYFNDNAPWKLVKTDRAEAGRVLRTCLEALRAMSVYLAPILPNTSARLSSMLGCELTSDWAGAAAARLEKNRSIGEVGILVTKLEDSQTAEEFQRMEAMAAKAEKPLAEVAPTAPALVSIDDFKKLKFRTAKVLEAERVPKSKKLLKLQIDTGVDKRQIVAGIAEKYSPEELVGKTIVVVANLQPAKLMGIESNGMLLAVNDEKGPVMLIEADGVAPGLEVR